MPNLLECGRIINTHGVRGELKVEPWCDSPDLFGQLTRLYVGGQPYQLETARPHKSFMLCKLAGIDSLEQAMALKNQTLFWTEQRYHWKRALILSQISLALRHMTGALSPSLARCGKFAQRPRQTSIALNAKDAKS